MSGATEVKGMAQDEPRPLPRFLLGAAALFWGVMIGQPLAGVVLALLLEASHWTPLRWELADRTYVRAWQLSVLLMGVSVVLWWLGSRNNPAEVYGALVWMPAYFLPLQLAQSFGMRPAIPLVIFSYFARRKYEQDLREGRPVKNRVANFGRVYLLVMLLCASLGSEASTPFFFPILIALLVWSLRSGSRFAQGPRRAWAVALGMVLCLGFVGQWSLREMYKLLSSGRWSQEEEEPQGAQRTRTRIGQIGEVKQSSKIFWRLQRNQGAFPSLLRTASYNRYSRGMWVHEQLTGESDREADYDAIRERDSYRLMRDEAGAEAAPPQLPRFSIRGRVAFHSLIPLPGDTRSMQYVLARELERNSLGTVRIQPEHAVLDTIVIWKDDKSVEQKPYPGSLRKDDATDLIATSLLTGTVPRQAAELGLNGSPLDLWFATLASQESMDLAVPRDEQQALRKIVDELQLRGKPVDTQVATLRGWFAKNFSYTKYLKIGDVKRGSPVVQFLTRTRSGHCEYFATAATLLLREAGTPARYAVGFSVQEVSPEGATIRGTHAHAWCRAWDESKQTWRDVDLTPPSWVAVETSKSDWEQRWMDAWQKFREDFVIWRTRPDNLGGITAVIVVLVLLLIAVPMWRLLRSGKRIRRDTSGKRIRRGELSPLERLEKPVSRQLGRRGAGETLVAWLRSGKERWSEQERPLWEEAFALHQRVRFDPDGAREEDRHRLGQLVDELRGLLKRRR